MTTNKTKPEPNSSFLTEKDSYAPAENLLVLGRKLVEELGLEESTDTLGRWMAHHIADLITKAEEAEGDDKASAERECFTAILELWKHRSELPNGKRPYEELEPVLRAVESLDPENDIPRYFRAARPPKDEAVETADQENWLGLIEGLDYTAKVLIGYCLAEASDAALDKTKEWVGLAAAIDDQAAPEIIIRYVSAATDVNKKQDPNQTVRSLLEDRISRLRGFLQISQSLVDTLEERRQALPLIENDSEDEESLVLMSRPEPPEEFPNG